MSRLDPGGAAESPTPRIDPEALRDGGRAFGAMAERCQVLAGALRGGSQALDHGVGRGNP